MTTFEQAKAIAQEHNPAVRPDRRTVRRCPRCNGDGELRHEGTSINPYSGVRVVDPQMETSEECPDCDGTGAVEIPAGQRRS